MSNSENEIYFDANKDFEFKMASRNDYCVNAYLHISKQMEEGFNTKVFLNKSYTRLGVTKEVNLNNNQINEIIKSIKKIEQRYLFTLENGEIDCGEMITEMYEIEGNVLTFQDCHTNGAWEIVELFEKYFDF